MGVLLKRFIMGRHWIVLLNLGLAAYIGHSAVELFFPRQAPPLIAPADASVTPGSRVSGQSSPPPGFDMSGVLSVHLFGKAEAEAAEKPKTPINAPETQLNLTLQGTLAMQNGKRQRAIIAGPDGKGKLYKIKDTLPGGALLHAIEADKVILFRGNGYETLPLRVEKLPGVTANRDLSSRGSKVNPAPDPALARKLGVYRRRILARPGSLSQYIRLRPSHGSGGLEGYVVMPGHNPRVLKEFGLQQGDVITSVNGNPLDSPVRGLSAMQQLAEASRVELEIVRHGQPMRLSFNFQ